MKAIRIVLFGGILASLLFSSCKNLGKVQSSDDDVYLDPKRDRDYFYKKEEEPKLVTNTTSALPTADTANNPYYKDKAFKYDDYYDNQYASRLRRFHSPLCGVGYYDSYYTNSYFYNGNPNQYGVSIYNYYGYSSPYYTSYSPYTNSYYWGNYSPSYFGSYGYYSSYYGYNQWNPYGYNSWNSPYYGYYNGFGNPYYGFGNGYYAGNYSGYSNPFDYNSNVHNGPRISHSGGNSRQVINPGSHMRVMSPSSTDDNIPKIAVAPTDIKRFEHIQIPKSNVDNGIAGTITNTPHIIHNNNTSANVNPAVVSNPKANTSTPAVSEPHYPKKNITYDNDVPASTSTSVNNNSSTPNTPSLPKKKLFNFGESNSVSTTGGNSVTAPNSNPTTPTTSTPKKKFFDNDYSPNTGSSPSTSTPKTFPSSSNSGSGSSGTVRPSTGGGGGSISPRPRR